MVLKADQERVRTLLKDTVTLLCRNGLHFKNKFNIEAVIGVTLDDEDVFLVSINELIRNETKALSDEETEDNSMGLCHQNNTASSIKSGRKRKRIRAPNNEEKETIHESPAAKISHSRTEFSDDQKISARSCNNPPTVIIKAESCSDDDQEQDDVVFVKRELDLDPQDLSAIDHESDANDSSYLHHMYSENQAGTSRSHLDSFIRGAGKKQPNAKRPRCGLTKLHKHEICHYKLLNPTVTHTAIQAWTAEMYSIQIGRSTICDILKDSDKWLNISEAEKRDTRAARKPRHKQLEDHLYLWLSKVTQEGQIKLAKDDVITEKAREIGAQLGIPENFTYSKGWLKRFKVRRGIIKNPRKTGGNPEEDDFCE